MRLPRHGEERRTAVRDLRRLLADDAVATALDCAHSADGQPWTRDAIRWVVDTHALWLHGVVDEAHDEAAAFLDWAGVIG